MAKYCLLSGVVLFLGIFITFFVQKLYDTKLKPSNIAIRQFIQIKNTHPALKWWNYNCSSDNIISCPKNIQCAIFSENEFIDNPNAYLFYVSFTSFDNLPLPRNPKEVVWAMFHEESPRNKEEFLFETVLNLFNFSSTFSRYSNVPFPLLHLNSLEDITSSKYFVKTVIKNSYVGDISPILYLNSDCSTSTERDEYMKELMKLIPVDSFGECSNNKELDWKFKEDYLNNLNDEEFLKFVAKYKFTIAIENGRCEDYVTEKFWRAIRVGSIPIYFGSPSIKDWLPNNKSSILIEEYPTVELLVEHIKKLMENDTEYEEYLTHKTKQIITNEKLIQEAKIHPYQFDFITAMKEFECFVCKKVHDKINGDNSWSVVNKTHYDCPKPISALSLSVNPLNLWVYSWEVAKKNAENIYSMVMEQELLNKL